MRAVTRTIFILSYFGNNGSLILSLASCIGFDTMTKAIEFLGDSRAAIRAFPESARQRAGFELRRVQMGLDPTDWRPLSGLGTGLREIRLRDESGAYRIIYVAKLAETVIVLHAFVKKSQKTPASDMKVARQRLAELRGA